MRFSVEAGGGSVEPTTATTGSDGLAATVWTMGTRTHLPQRVLASADEADAAESVRFAATAVADVGEEMELVTGDGQLGQRSAPLPRSVSVRVKDRFGNPVSGEPVSFTVEGGAGSFAPAEAETDGAGVARSQWTLGPELGEQLGAAAANGLPSVAFTATALEQPFAGVLLHSVLAGEVEAELQLADPGFDASGPGLEVEGGETLIQGGGGVLDVTADRDFATLYVFVDDHDGYFELDLSAIEPAREDSAGGVVYELALVFEEILTEDEYELGLAAGTGGGPGPRTPHHVRLQPVTTGPVQVSVAWDVPSDLDLYLVEPSGDVINFEQPTSESGGVHELDSNPGCQGDDWRNESITWPEATPPTGTYTVRLAYWSSCEQERTRWLVVVRVEGTVVRVVEGVFTGDGGIVGEADAAMVTTFTF